MTERSAATNVRGHHAERAEDDTWIETERDTSLHGEKEVEAAHLIMGHLRIVTSYLMASLWT